MPPQPRVAVLMTPVRVLGALSLPGEGAGSSGAQLVSEPYAVLQEPP